MLYYPQLLTGCVAQYPLAKRHTMATIVNELPGGDRFKFSVSQARAIEWDLQYTGVISDEMAMLVATFQLTEGRLYPVVFADPFGNLVARSEEFHLAPWISGPQLQWTAGITDPHSGTRARRVVNAGAVDQSLSQSIEQPANFHLCFSFWARSAAPATLTVSRTAAAETMTRSVKVTTEWKRHEIGTQLSGTEGPSAVAIWLPPGAAVDLFGAQVEGQLHASGYKKTSAVSDVFADARFCQDQLFVQGDDKDLWSARVRVIAREVV